jgi:tRNA (guanosine-2'-O-)-methyltransferase
MPAMTQRRYHRIQQVLRHRQPDLTLLAEDVHKPHNLSAMLRTADAVGVDRVHATHPTGGLPTFSATSASAERWVELVVHPSLEDALRGRPRPGDAGLRRPLRARRGRLPRRRLHRARPAWCSATRRTASALAAAAAADARIVIPMLGMVPSLNVSVATAVVMFEAQRQRQAAGAYARRG